jgi:hypothetical protein
VVGGSQLVPGRANRGQDSHRLPFEIAQLQLDQDNVFGLDMRLVCTFSSERLSKPLEFLISQLRHV